MALSSWPFILSLLVFFLNSLKSFFSFKHLFIIQYSVTPWNHERRSVTSHFKCFWVFCSQLRSLSTFHIRTTSNFIRRLSKNISSFHFSLICVNSSSSCSLSISRSFLTRSSHRCLGLPLGLLLLDLQFDTVRVGSLFSCSAHLILWLSIAATILGSLDRVTSSLFDLILYPLSV